MNDDERIIEFSKYSVDDIYLPKKFKYEEPKWIIYAAGDGRGGYFEGRSSDITNIEVFSKKGYNIFCCIGKEKENIEYLTKHPKLNVVICILEGEDKTKDDYAKLKKLFNDSIDLIDTDDTRFYIPSDIAYDLLVSNGICLNVVKNIREDSKHKNYRNSNGRLLAHRGYNRIGDKGWEGSKFREVQDNMYIKVDMKGGRRKNRKTKSKTRKLR